MIYDGTRYYIANNTPVGATNLRPFNYSNDAITWSGASTSNNSADGESIFSIPQPYLAPPIYNCDEPFPTPSPSYVRPTPTVTTTITPTRTPTPTITPTKSPI